MREFKGRVILGGNIKGEALVSKRGFNALVAYQDLLFLGEKPGYYNDFNDKEIFGKLLAGSILCAPQAIGSSANGEVIQAAAYQDMHPAALLLANTADSLAISGVLLADIWVNKPIITVDELGDEFLDYVKTGSKIEVFEDGTVRVE